MRTLTAIITLLMFSAASVPSAWAQAIVTIRGTIRSMDSARANMVVRSSGQDRLIILPVNVPVTAENDNAAPRMSVNDLAEGGLVLVEATKSQSGQLTARRVTVLPGQGGTTTPSGPSRANQVTIQPSRGGPGGVLVTPDAKGIGSHFVAARASLLGQRVGELHVNGRTVFRFRGTRGEDPFVRATTVASRLNSPAMANLRPNEVRAGRAGGQWAVMARGAVLITADATTARINRTSPRRLAELWAANMRAQLQTAPQNR